MEVEICLVLRIIQGYNIIYLPKKEFTPMRSSWDRFEETQLPPTEAFYSNVNMSNISKDDYQHAQKVWKEFGIRNLGDYHDLYHRTDVTLLANVFEVFRDICLEHYGLDPAHFYTSPGLAWKAYLRKTRVRLELLTDPYMLLMFERGIRGGMTQAVHRYTSANNHYMGDQYDLSQDSSYLEYIDTSYPKELHDSQNDLPFMCE